MSLEKKKFPCSYEGCNLTFDRFVMLTQHMNVHTNTRPFVCSYKNCDRSYTRPQHLKRHEETHAGQLKCPYESCEMIFKSKATLTKHIDNIHLRKKPKIYQCSYCDEQFNKNCWLKKHEYRHTGIRPYVCTHEGCEKRFLVPSKLKRHLKMHDGYKCTKPNCNEVLSKWTLYLKHLQVAHPNVYKCEGCDKQFSSFFNLKAHIEVHSKDREVYGCPEPNCSRVYYCKRNLTHHLKSYHEKRPFVCKENFCSKAFKTEENLNKHFRRYHNPNSRLPKKKKHKPSFAAKLSGCVPRKSGKTKTVEVSVVANEESSNNETQEDGDKTAAQDSEDCMTGDDIQGLLHEMDKRDACGSAQFVNLVSFKEFVKI